MLSKTGPLDGPLTKVETCNNFFGGNLGVEAEFKLSKKFILDLKGQCALGTTLESVKVGGVSVGGNNNSSHNNRFSVVPEASANLGYQITDWWRVSIGYDFLYWTKVVRAGDQKDLALTTPPPGGAGRNPSDFWAQGVNFGMEFRF
jgi:hypothetical protein